MKKKSELRNEMTRILAALDERWLGAASRELSGKLEQLIETKLGRPVEHILAWTKFFPGEPDLSSLIFSQLDSRSVYLPRSLPDRTMDFISIGRDWHMEAEAGAYGILEPKDNGGANYDLQNAARTVVLIPGIAFDRKGNRLGRGKGYYDIFLGMPEMEEAIKIGICWSLQIADKVPVKDNDVPVDWICHEEGYIETQVIG